MPDAQREAIGKEMDRYLSHSTAVARRNWVVWFAVDSVQRRHQAQLERDLAEEEVEELKVKLTELDDWAAELEEYLLKYEDCDGRPGPVLRAKDKEIRDLKRANSCLETDVDYQNSRLKELECKVPPRSNVAVQTEVRSHEVESQDAVDFIRQLEAENARLIKELAFEKRASAGLRQDLESVERRLEASEGAPYETLYVAPILVDKANNADLLKELGRLTHNENVSRNAARFYEMRHEHVRKLVEHLEHDVGIHFLHHRSWMKAKEDDMISLRRKLLELPSQPLSPDCQRWTRHDLRFYLDLPREELRSVGDRYSSPPVLVVLPHVDAAATAMDVDLALCDVEMEIMREVRNCDGLYL
ncbi:hypothetical protein OC844_006667 [Tilletia horrida]|nr:hypothetical protein OC844_006667 [Tilletia horrida]